MAVGISVYDHTVSGEEFLGYVNFQASQESDEAVKGWFALEGHADTMAENAPMVQANFQGFTFVDESALDDHMRDRLRMNNDDEDMDDARGARESATTGESGDHVNNDDDWDNLDDIDPRKANRMSGIMKGSPHDDQMVGGSHFDP
ncbi:hypothetical protein GMORB2_5732 [Geosmithia morbida]|uniref:Uncharacterized protein n=1 Tax=Geosmithia morbida TaxID=1094350 RepID=A0A9P4YYD1_9HYPO|nr:uncharacterized protein GMORB2_5732 [Geosmithia morbida]KAF4124016.1 hypothetical protein GMORB2_5732 [Geosmithia morbida]